MLVLAKNSSSAPSVRRPPLPLPLHKPTVGDNDILEYISNQLNTGSKEKTIPVCMELMYALLKEPYATWPNRKTITELNSFSEGLLFFDVPALRLPASDRKLDGKVYTEFGSPMASISCLHVYRIRNDDINSMWYTNDLIDFICHW
jgi:hypothetical protein